MYFLVGWYGEPDISTMNEIVQKCVLGNVATEKADFEIMCCVEESILNAIEISMQGCCIHRSPDEG